MCNIFENFSGFWNWTENWIEICKKKLKAILLCPFFLGKGFWIFKIESEINSWAHWPSVLAFAWVFSSQLLKSWYILEFHPAFLNLGINSTISLLLFCFIPGLPHPWNGGCLHFALLFVLHTMHFCFFYYRHGDSEQFCTSQALYVFACIWMQNKQIASQLIFKSLTHNGKAALTM